jgi:TfoX/Sxy family transcriptional regulator of competence genes
MAKDDELATRVRRILGRRERVVERAMMGGLAFLVDGSMCCSVGRDGLLVRVAADDRERILGLAHVQPMKLGGRTMTGFVRVAAAGLRTEAALRRWIERGIDAGIARKRPAR